MAEETTDSTQKLQAEVLALQQAGNQAAQLFNELVAEGRSYKKPSKFKYGILFTLAIIADLLDFLELTGIGLVVSEVLSAFIALLMVFIFWVTGTRQQDAKKYAKKLQEFLGTTGQNLSRVTRLAARAGKVEEFAASHFSILEKFSLSALTDLIPVLNLFPWMTFGVWLSYRDEKRTLAHAARAAEMAAEDSEAELENLEVEEEQLALAA